MSAGTENIKRKRGGQPGNKNAVGNRGGAPFGNRNAWKHGAYAGIKNGALLLAIRVHMVQGELQKRLQ